jgi:GNAT superfamily N-acetyltransferase
MEAGMISCRDSQNIRFVDSPDRDFWLSLDRHISDEEFDRKVRDRMGYVLTVQNVPVGLLRYSLFWDNTPFCNLLYVAQDHQRKGYGRMLMEHWERDMHTRGYDLVMTSTQADENAQHFYRALGYRDCGGFILPFPGHEQPMEIILAKVIGNPT